MMAIQRYKGGQLETYLWKRAGEICSMDIAAALPKVYIWQVLKREELHMRRKLGLVAL